MLAKALLDQVVGQDAAVARLAALIEPLTGPQSWARPVLPVAVVGPTATGKTLIVRAAAKAIGASLCEFDGSAFSATELRDRLRGELAAAIVRPGIKPSMHVVLVEHVSRTDPAALLWLLGDKPAIYVAESSVPTLLTRVLLVVTITAARPLDCKDNNPLKTLDPTIGRHFAGRMVSLEPADVTHVPELIERRLRLCADVSGRFSTDHRTAAVAAFQPEFGYGPVADAVDTTVAGLRLKPVVTPSSSTEKHTAISTTGGGKPPTDAEAAAEPVSSTRLLPESKTNRSIERRFTANVLDSARRRSNWQKHGVDAKLTSAVMKLSDTLQALARQPPAEHQPNNDALVWSILTHKTIWPLLLGSPRIPKVVARDLLLLTHGDRFKRSAALHGTWSRHLIDNVWRELEL